MEAMFEKLIDDEKTGTARGFVGNNRGLSLVFSGVRFKKLKVVKLSRKI